MLDGGVWLVENADAAMETSGDFEYTVRSNNHRSHWADRDTMKKMIANILYYMNIKPLHFQM